MQNLGYLKYAMSPAYGLVLFISSGIGAHTYYCSFKYSEYKREIYTGLFGLKNTNGFPILKLQEFRDLADIPDNGDGRFAALLPVQDKSKLLLKHEINETIQKNTPQTIFLSLAAGLFFPIGTSLLLGANLVSRVMLFRQANEVIEKNTDNLRDLNSLLETRREMYNLYKETKEYTEVVATLLIPLIAGKSLFYKL